MSVIWHDIECGRYAEDLELWRSLAERHGDPVLDIGAGTGRTALDLAKRGHRVTALDQDPELVAELRRRAHGLELDVVLADARSFALGRRFALCMMPMQTIQLLGGRDGRAAFLRCALAHLEPGGVLAVALSSELEPYEVLDGGPAPMPDVLEREGVLYASQPVAVREDADGYVLARRRETVDARGPTERDPARSADRGRARGRSARRRVQLGEPRPDLGDRGLRRQRGGDRGCLSFASARCTPT
jgi:SAM-dependent methyltransferase